MKNLKSLDLVAIALIIVGGLNWGLVATLVGLDFGETNAASRVVYGLVGLAAVYEAVRLPNLLRRTTSDRRMAAA